MTTLVRALLVALRLRRRHLAPLRLRSPSHVRTRRRQSARAVRCARAVRLTRRPTHATSTSAYIHSITACRNASQPFESATVREQSVARAPGRRPRSQSHCVRLMRGARLEAQAPLLRSVLTASAQRAWPPRDRRGSQSPRSASLSGQRPSRDLARGAQARRGQRRAPSAKSPVATRAIV